MSTNTDGVQHVRADAVRVGDHVVESDGAMLEVTETRRERGVVVIVCKRYGILRGSPSARVRPSTMVRIADRT